MNDDRVDKLLFPLGFFFFKEDPGESHCGGFGVIIIICGANLYFYLDCGRGNKCSLMRRTIKYLNNLTIRSADIEGN